MSFQISFVFCLDQGIFPSFLQPSSCFHTFPPKGAYQLGDRDHAVRLRDALMLVDRSILSKQLS